MKIYLDSIGCRLNQAEIEAYARQFRSAGHTLVSTPEQADLAVINTCTVTAAADSDSRQKIRQASAAGARQVVVTGCWSTLHPQSAALLPGVSGVIPNLEKHRLVSDILETDDTSIDIEPLERNAIRGARLRTRAFIKVQDGCNNQCTFCITTLARGEERSRRIPEILADILSVMGGSSQGDSAREIVLTGVHLGSWGRDLQPRQCLVDLLRAILEYTSVERVRLSSLEPWDIDEEYFRLWEDRRICRHLHLPLQSGSFSTLRRMARRTTPGFFSTLLQVARLAIPEVAITTDLIAGFPGETETEFAESLAFIEAMQFAGGHVFTYSARPGTPAARLPNQVPHPIRKARNASLHTVLAKSAARYQAAFVGYELPVLWESAVSLGPGGWELSGLTDNYLRVIANTPRRMWNEISMVRLVSVDGERLRGEVVT